MRSSAGIWARLPLRVKLVATLLLLVIIALVGSGFAASATMRSYLVGRVDGQLADVAEHPIDGVTAGPGGDRHGADGTADGSPADSSAAGSADQGRQKLPSAFVIEVTDARGTVVYGPTSNLVDASQPLPELPGTSSPGSARTFTTGSVRGDGQWRVRADPVTLADGGPGTVLVAQSLGDVRGTLDRLTVLLAIIGACAVLAVAAVGYLIVRASLRPLQRVEHTAAAIAAGDLTRRVPDTDSRTEVGQLSAALNRMLAEIETAFDERAASEAAARTSQERMRRFVADASHELRTPLTSIRGFAELYRHGAVGSEADLRRLMGRIENEAERMGLLVEDLLMLARLDQQRPLAREPVDLLALAADAVHDAEAVDPSRPIRLAVGATDPPPIVTGDEPRLRQVLANLVGNALQHTPAGTPVTVRLRTEPDRVVLDVADDGPGMSPDDTARVFERFYRADRSRNRNDGGTGLGLAIVSALVAGHGGSVRVASQLGTGSCFTVELPLAAVPAGSARIGE